MTENLPQVLTQVDSSLHEVRSLKHQSKVWASWHLTGLQISATEFRTKCRGSRAVQWVISLRPALPYIIAHCLGTSGFNGISASRLADCSTICLHQMTLSKITEAQCISSTQQLQLTRARVQLLSYSFATVSKFILVGKKECACFKH